MIFLWAFTALFFVYSFFITVRCNFTLGVFMLWCIFAALLCVCLFHRPIFIFLQTKVGRITKWAAISGILVFAGLFSFVALSGYTGKATGNEKAIIVLGAGLNGEQVSDLLRRRLSAALDEWRQNPTAVIVVSGGQGEKEAVPEAIAMQRWLLANGVPADKILLEQQSTSTEENLLFSMAILEEYGIAAEEPVAIVTNAFHCYRAKQYALRIGYTHVTTVAASIHPLYVLPSYTREIAAILYMWVFK